MCLNISRTVVLVRVRVQYIAGRQIFWISGYLAIVVANHSERHLITRGDYIKRITTIT